MRHASLRGQRYRPLLFVLTVPRRDCHAAAIDVGCAVEMVCTASLILDELPCMDDADLRRNKPTTQKALGQTAILAAIWLLIRGINILSTVAGVPTKVRSRLVHLEPGSGPCRPGRGSVVGPQPSRQQRRRKR
jgi:geranylgeranyl diphosphate synthase type II